MLLRLSRTRADAYWTRAAQELTSPATDPRTAAKSRTTPRALRGKSSARVGIEPYNCCATQLEAWRHAAGSDRTMRDGGPRRCISPGLEDWFPAMRPTRAGKLGNHPDGGSGGICLGHIARRYRADEKSQGWESADMAARLFASTGSHLQTRSRWRLWLALVFLCIVGGVGGVHLPRC